MIWTKHTYAYTCMHGQGGTKCELFHLVSSLFCYPCSTHPRADAALGLNNSSSFYFVFARYNFGFFLNSTFSNNTSNLLLLVFDTKLYMRQIGWMWLDRKRYLFCVDWVCPAWGSCKLYQWLADWQNSIQFFLLPKGVRLLILFSHFVFLCAFVQHFPPHLIRLPSIPREWCSELHR